MRPFQAGNQWLLDLCYRDCDLVSWSPEISLFPFCFPKLTFCLWIYQTEVRLLNNVSKVMANVKYATSPLCQIVFPVELYSLFLLCSSVLHFSFHLPAVNFFLQVYQHASHILSRNIVSSAVSCLSVRALPLLLPSLLSRSTAQLLSWTCFSLNSFLCGTMSFSGLCPCFIEAYIRGISWEVFGWLDFAAHLMVQQHIEMKVWSNSPTECWHIAVLSSGIGYCSRDGISHLFHMLLFPFLPPWS